MKSTRLFPPACCVIALLAACSSETKQSGTKDTGEPIDVTDSASGEIEDSSNPDTDATLPPDSNLDADGSIPDGDDADTNTCSTPAVFGCPCSGNGDCLDEMCIEGPDGNVCTRSCAESCPTGFDCLNVSLGGSDPVSICVPRHTRLCRPCGADSDCQNALDPAPAVCLAFPKPEDGSFCATSCAGVDCPDGYACSDVDLGVDRGTAKLCLPSDGTCECRESWTDLALQTSCLVENEFGGCSGVRACGADGLTSCSGATPALESCNKLDDDCDGVTDNIAADDCTNQNDFGHCAGKFACNSDGELVCTGLVPGPERCNDIDDNCNGQTDEAWTDCLPSGCNATDGGYIETGDATCVKAQCAYTNPKPCGLYTCDGGGDAGDQCANGCNDDSTCIAAAHCDEASQECVPDVANGGACSDASDCASGHCQNGFCCGDGDCCSQPTDCPANYAAAAICESGTSCQGTRRDARCTDSQCATSAPIADDSGCSTEILALDCAPYLPRYCNGSVNQNAPACATTCSSDGDCAAGYHCDGTCVPNVQDGIACDEDTDCASAHCENNFCCKNGDCCAQTTDCPALYHVAAHCLDGQSCQGERTDALCTDHECKTQVVQDDSGCDTNIVSNECGPYASAKCTGAVTQSAPQCPFTCQADSECDTGFHCDFVCVPNLPDGNYCDENSDCANAHCNNNICCVGGDCCNQGRDCPASYSGAPACDFPQTCQGTKDAAVCVNHVCGTTAGAADDSACTAATLANDCGAYPAVRCNGAVDQNSPACPTSCDANSACDADAFCDHGTCRPKQDNGAACGDPSQCTSGHCQNSFCCATGDCCAAANNCSTATYGTPASCDSQSTCQGSRKDPVCNNNQCALGPTVADDSACAGLEANKCGYFDSVFCTAAQEQTAPTCAANCAGNSACDDGAHCENTICKADTGVGGLCPGGQIQCGAGLTCVDGVCCSTGCSGTCKRCDVGGNLGICQNSSTGTDPDSDCGGVSCTGYYWGFEGKTCYGRAAIVDTGVQCDGTGTCQTASDVCPAAGKGAGSLTCHAQCQSPTAGTCSGTTPGGCTNISGGTQTCGVGACQRTVDLCANGTVQACTPGVASAEVCDGIDNDCDGKTDETDPDLVLVPCDNQNGVCAGSTKPKTLCFGGQWHPCTATNYSAFTALYQDGKETSCETTLLVAGKDNDCDGQIDEDFNYTSPAGTVTAGASKACGVGECAGGTTVCSNTTTLTCSTNNKIANEICDGKDNDCDGQSDSSDASLVLDQNCLNQNGVCAGSKKPATLCSAGAWQACTTATYGAYSAFYQVTETLCDGKDNDCSGAVDNGLSPPLNDNQLGVCSGSTKACAGAGGWTNSYTGVANYNATEATPDANYRDENCDGIDGDVTKGIFVRPPVFLFGTNIGGQDSASCGTSKDSGWCATVAYAVGRTDAAHPNIYVLTGNYNGIVDINKANVKIWGGYNTSWIRASRGTAGNEVHLTNTGGATSESQYMTVRVVSMTGVGLYDLYIDGPNASGQDGSGRGMSSYAVYTRSSTVDFQRVTVTAGNGSPGLTGSSGTSASQGKASTGGGGSSGSEPCDGGCSTSRPGGGVAVASVCSGSTDTTSGSGGSGGSRDSDCGWCGCTCGSCSAGGGAAGNNATVTSGASGTAGGGAGACASPSTGGNSGRVIDGGGGAGAAFGRGYLDTNYWYAFDGADGTLGENGGGGGGAGGGGGCNDGGCDASGGGGGGGGAGGCRASAPGRKGTGAGASFGIFGYVSTLTVSSSTIARGTGGAGGGGGAGGSGQPGGDGGAGGSGGNPADGNPGKSGGVGGRGGHAGGGGGGAGGGSFGVFRYAGGGTDTGNTFTGGAAGSPGAAGGGSISGSAGISGELGGSVICNAPAKCNP